jgi:hypothetical protein
MMRSPFALLKGLACVLFVSAIIYACSKGGDELLQVRVPELQLV